MRHYVVISTKGRAPEVNTLLSTLESQTRQPDFIVVVGTTPDDLAGLEYHPWVNSGRGIGIVSARVGLAAQRNEGLDYLVREGYLSPNIEDCCLFFDDDFRPDPLWIENASHRFIQGNVVGLTGHVLADGVHSGALSEEIASDYLENRRPAEPHWASGDQEREIGSVYGCNMMFSARICSDERFDERLALYGWQEDRDYSARAARRGRIIYYPECRGVHLGSTRGRISGLRFGYSQIANPIYLMKKGTMRLGVGLRFIFRAIVSNIIHTVFPRNEVDYFGRCSGNFRAIKDVIFFRVDPANITKF